MRVARVLTGVLAASVAATGEVVTLTQLRVLVLAATRGALNSTAVAEALAIHPSNASRLCDRLVQGGFLNRRDSPTDRRHVELTLTERGDSLVSAMFAHRRRAFTRILAKLTPHQREAFLSGVQPFSEAAGEPDEGEWFALTGVVERR